MGLMRHLIGVFSARATPTRLAGEDSARRSSVCIRECVFLRTGF